MESTMNEIQTARILTELGSEVVAIQERASAAIIEANRCAENLGRIMDSLAAVNGRIYEIVHSTLGGDYIETRVSGKNQIGAIVSAEIPGKGDAAPSKAPEAHRDRRIVTEAASSEAASGVEEGPDARLDAVGHVGNGAQSGQVTEGAGAGSTEPAPISRPSIYDPVLDRFALTGGSHAELAEEFGVRLAIISQCLVAAREGKDPRAAQGDLKRIEAVEGVKGIDAAAEAAKGSTARGSWETVPPEPEEIGRPLAHVAFTDGVATRADTGDHVRMKGQYLRVVSLLKDQRFYVAEDIVKACRLGTETIFRTILIDVQRSLKTIGLHIVEDGTDGFQLRRLADPLPGTA